MLQITAPDCDAAHLEVVRWSHKSVIAKKSCKALRQSCDARHIGNPQQALTSQKREGEMTVTFAECAENARQCKWFASKTSNEEERKFLLRMARYWAELAAEKERELRDAARSAG